MNESTADNDDSLAKSQEKESIQDKYYKLRDIAVKLKKKGNDLTQQLRVSETERIKISADKEDLQNKLIQISENARKFQTIHSEYDKLQDDLEQEKCKNKKLEKNLECLMFENTSLKESLYEKKENITKLSNRNECLTKENAKLKLILKQNQDKINALMDEMKTELVIREQRDKEYEEMKSTLNLEIDIRKTIQAQLETFKQEYATNNALSLEVENYEKSIKDLQTKLNEEAAKNDSFKDTIENHLMTIDSLNEQVVELWETCLKKTNQLTILGEKNELIKQELCQVNHMTTEHKKKMDELINELGDLDGSRNRLNEQIEALSTENCRLLQELKHLDEAHNKKVTQLENEIVNLNKALTKSHNEMEALQTESTGHKLQPESVPRNKQSHSKDTGSDGRSLNEIEEELEHTRTQAALLQEKLENHIQRLEYATREISVLTEERDQTYTTLNEIIEKMNVHRQQFSSSMGQRRSESFKSQEMKIEVHPQTHKMEIRKYKCRSNDNVTNVHPERQADSEAGTENHPRFSGMSISKRENRERSESVNSCASVETNIVPEDIVSDQPNRVLRRRKVLPSTSYAISDDDSDDVEEATRLKNNNKSSSRSYAMSDDDSDDVEEVTRLKNNDRSRSKKYDNEDEHPTASTSKLAKISDDSEASHHMKIKVESNNASRRPVRTELSVYREKNGTPKEKNPHLQKWLTWAKNKTRNMAAPRMRNFAAWEKWHMLIFLVENDLIDYAKGLDTWQFMVAKEDCGHRTKSSLNNHFLKYILPDIEKFRLPKNVEKKFVALRSIKEH